MPLDRAVPAAVQSPAADQACARVASACGGYRVGGEGWEEVVGPRGFGVPARVVGWGLLAMGAATGSYAVAWIFHGRPQAQLLSGQ